MQKHFKVIIGREADYAEQFTFLSFLSFFFYKNLTTAADLHQWKASPYFRPTEMSEWYSSQDTVYLGWSILLPSSRPL